MANGEPRKFRTEILGDPAPESVERKMRQLEQGNLENCREVVEDGRRFIECDIVVERGD